MLGRVKALQASTLAVVATVVTGCGGAQPAGPSPAQIPPGAAPACDAYQAAISRDADERAEREHKPPFAQHLATSFPDGRVSWLMREADYQRYVVGPPAATKWGRCNRRGDTCYVFAAPAAVIRAKVQESMTDGRHDPARLGQALGLPEKNLEGPLRMMTLDLDEAGTCARLPVCTDLGARECSARGAQDEGCFQFGGYTTGGVAEIMVINAPVAQTRIEVVP
jgi:hypothetical protein